MKSKFAKSHRALASVLLASLFGTAAIAGVASTQGNGAGFSLAANEPTVRVQGPDRELPTQLNQSQRNNSQTIMQCWQRGQLIIDEREWLPASNASGGGPQFRSNTGPHGKMQLMPFGETFCMYRSERIR